MANKQNVKFQVLDKNTLGLLQKLFHTLLRVLQCYFINHTQPMALFQRADR